MPHPKPSSPYQEVAFQLGEHTLVAVSYLSREPESPQGPGPQCDLFNDGQSLSGGPSLAQTRDDAPHPGDVYPNAFRLVDLVLYITPGAAAPALFVGLGNASANLDGSTLAAIGAVLLGALALAVAVTRYAWVRIRTDASQSVGRRAALGWAVLLATYGVAFVGGTMVAVAIRSQATWRWSRGPG